MLKIYKFPLILSNYKLYNSPYNKNIVEVYDTLKNYKIKCRLNYLNNLKTLKIEAAPSFGSEETLYDLIEYNFSCARYFPKKNLIELVQNHNKIEKTINHELFHVSSNNPNNPNFINFEGSINIIEGITDYLGKKSKNSKYTPGYKLELLVVEFLISILGENKIIEKYPRIWTYKYVADFLDSKLSKDETLRLQFKMAELESMINYLTKFKSRKKR